MEAHASSYILHFIVGALIVLSFLLGHFLRKIGIPAIVGFLLMGMMLITVDSHVHLISEGGTKVFHFMANVGLIVLLFRTGLESDTAKLKEELGPAGVIWFGNFFLSAILGFAAAYYLLGLALIPSFVVATAFTATSIAVSIGIWRESDMMNRRESNLLLNVAQMDDVSGVAVLALLLAAVPMMQAGGEFHTSEILSTMGMFALYFVVFSLGCLLFAKYLEAPITRFFNKISSTDSCLMLLTAGSGVMIAAIAEGLGISLAVGALFAGLVFSNNPQAKHIDEMIVPLYNLFAPFFFIGIGMSIDPAYFMSGIGIGLVLLVPAVLGKVIGGALPALKYLSGKGALALGLSLVPRAEIMLVIAGSAKQLGPDVIPDEIFAAMVFISAISCILTPPVVRPLLKMLKEEIQEAGEGESAQDKKEAENMRNAA